MLALWSMRAPEYRRRTPPGSTGAGSDGKLQAMRYLRYLLLSLALLVLLPIVLVVLAIEDQPAQRAAPALTVADLERVKQLLRSHDPRWLPPGQRRDVTLSQRDLDLALHQLLTRFRQAPLQSADIALGDQSAWLQVSLAVPASPLGNVLNLAVQLAAQDGQLSVAAARVGRLPVPGWLARAGLDALEPRAGQAALFATIREFYATTSAWSIAPQTVRFSFIARPELAWRLESRGRDLLLPAEERERVAYYLGQASRQAGPRPSGPRPMVPLVRDIVALAAVRSGEGRDPRAENRAAMLALAMLAIGRHDVISRVLGPAAPRAALGAVTLRTRQDLAQHWLVSAALALESDGRTADVIGIFKEVLDSRGGTGFSFADLTADRAGVRFGEAAAADPRGWQRRVATLASESDLMPSIDDMPEGLQEPEFQKRFRARDNQAYAQVLAQIEQRIDRCLFFARKPG